MRPYLILTYLSLLLWFGVSPFAGAQTPNRVNSSGRLEETLHLLAAMPDSTSDSAPTNAVAGKKRPLTAKEKEALQTVTAFRRDLERFAVAAPSLTPEVAAAQWMGFVDRFFAIQPHQGGLVTLIADEKADTHGADVSPLSLQDLIDSLPPPSSWQGIRAAILKRPIPPAVSGANAREKTDWLRRTQERLLRLFAQRLVGDEDGQWTEWTALNQDRQTMAQASIAAAKASKTSKAQQAERERLGDLLMTTAALWEIGDGLIKRTRNPQKAVTGIEWLIAARITDVRIASVPTDAPNPAGNGYLILLPDTPGFAESQEAKTLIRRLLISPEFSVNVPPDSAVQRLTRRVAVENLAQLPNRTSIWELTCDLSEESRTLYETLARRFPKAKPTDENARARCYQVARLAIRGRTQEAVNLARNLRSPETLFNGDIAQDIEKAGRNREWYEFLRELVRRWPAAPVWESLVKQSAALGRGEEALTLARANVARKNLSPEEREQAWKALSDAALSYDRVNEGVAALREAAHLSLQNAFSQQKEIPSRYRSRHPGADAALPYAQQFVKLGKALNRPDLTEEGLRVARHAFRPGEERSLGDRNYTALLIETGRYDDAEKTLLDILRREATMTRKDYQTPDLSLIRMCLTALVGVYDAQKRYADVVTVLEKGRGWLTDDLRNLLTESTGKATVGMAAAHALAAKGRTREAIAITEESLVQHPADAAYAFYLQCVGAEAALPFLDKLVARNRFQERPLIWKATALFRLKRYDEAEKEARAAIQIDPSDGDAPHGDRMRAYAILADIRQAQGDAAETKFLHRIVQAIRAAERADDIADAGLTSRAIRLYGDALTVFADAYCIQSRLAVRLAGMGRFAEAETHFRKAYELMPDSFGRMESHCFGCEGAFSSPQAAKIAERTLTRMATERPNKPQIFYLLGYIQAEQERYAEALPNFQKAVALDPDYINAWARLAQLREKVALSPEDKEAITRNLLRLSPQNVFDLSLRDAGDAENQSLADKYRMAQEMVAALKTGAGAPLFPLPASAAALKGQQPPSSREEIARQTMDSLVSNDFVLQGIRAMAQSLRLSSEQ